MLIQMLVFVSSAALAVMASGYLVLAVLLFEAKAKRTQALNLEHRRFVAARRAHALRGKTG